MNIYPVEGFTFDYYQRINNIKFITDTGDCNKYTIKYIGNIYNQNYVILYADGQKNETLVTKSNFSHNSKLSASRYNKDKSREKKHENYHASARAISLTEMLQNMSRYSNVETDMVFVDIATALLDFRISYRIYISRGYCIEDRSEALNVYNNARMHKQLSQWRNFTVNQLLILK